MTDEKERTTTTTNDQGHAPAPEPSLSTATGEMLDDDELDSLCDVTLGAIAPPAQKPE